MDFELPHDVVCACAKRDEPPSQQAINIELPHDVVCACAKRDEPPSQQAMNIELPHDVVSACAKRDEPPNQQAMNIELPHDVVCACAKRDEPPSRRSRLHHSRSTFCFIIKSFGILSARLRGFCLFRVFSGLPQIRVHSCPFVVSQE